MPKTTTLELHQKIRANFKAQWDADTDKLCKSALNELEKEIGQERLRLTVEAFLAHENFFQVANIRKHIPAAQKEWPRCDRCRGRDGFVYVQVEGEKMPRAWKCDHKAAQPSVLVWVGPVQDRRQVWATVLDYIDQRIAEEVER